MKAYLLLCLIGLIVGLARSSFQEQTEEPAAAPADSLPA